MPKKTIVLVALLILAPVIIYYLMPSDENRIRKLFREGVKAFEEERQEDLLSVVSFNYSDDRGLSYLYLKEAAKRVFARFDNLSLKYKISDIAVEGDKATAVMDVSALRLGQETGHGAEPLRIKFYLEKERMKWHVVRTEGLPQGY